MIDEEFVVRADRDLLHEDVPLHARPFHVAMKWRQKAGISGDLFAPELWKALMAIYHRQYPSGDFSIPPLFEGGARLRDQFYPVRVQIVYGTVSVDPVKCIQISPGELENLWQQNLLEGWRAIYAVTDLWDFAYGIDDLKGHCADADVLWNKARSTIAATARVLAGRQDCETAVETACLSAELSLKGALAFLGMDERQRRKLGHQLGNLAVEITTKRASKNSDRLIAASKEFPDYVNARYATTGLSRAQIMDLAMRGQFVAGEAIRHVSERNLSGQIEAGTNGRPRDSF